MHFVSHVWQHIRAGDNLDDIDINVVLCHRYGSTSGQGIILMTLTPMCFVSQVWQHIRAGDNLDDIDINVFCVTRMAAHQGRG
jgi:hypothetical protein